MRQPIIHDSRKVIKRELIKLNGREYWDITFEDGEEILVRWDKKAKIQVTLIFTQDEEVEKEALKGLESIIRDAPLEFFLSFLRDLSTSSNQVQQCCTIDRGKKKKRKK